MILWKESLWINALRLFCAGVVWFLVALFAGERQILEIFYIFPVFYLFWATIAMAGNWILPGNWIVQLISLMPLLTIVAGDPIVFLLRLLFPRLVPMKYYYPLNRHFFLYIHTEDFGKT